MSIQHLSRRSSGVKELTRHGEQAVIIPFAGSGSFGLLNDAKKPKMTETLANGYSYMIVLSESFPMNTNMTRRKILSKFSAFLCL